MTTRDRERALDEAEPEPGPWNWRCTGCGAVFIDPPRQACDLCGVGDFEEIEASAW